jgi:2-polyprenyl-6-methoxyphenol hydroxylase-like FAD-dependent oxidoreductase
VRYADIVIIGGGLAGSTAAAMLGRAGTETLLVDPHEVYPPDFRCEKLDEEQLGLLAKTGLGEIVTAAATPYGENWIVRAGRLTDRRPSGHRGILYDTLVNAVRSAIPESVSIVRGKAKSIAVSDDRQSVTLATGEDVSARLIILANGLNAALRRNFGMERHDISPNHSISIGFDIIPVGRSSFDFRALTYVPEDARSRIAYLSLFPIGGTTRANLFVYREMTDPWLSTMRDHPVETLLAALPGLQAFTGDIAIPAPVRIRPADLYVTTGLDKPGVVAVGDAYSTSCPSAGTGTGKVFTDVERLCNHYIPKWLATPGMSAAKIAAFYADSVKAAYEITCRERAFRVRDLAINTGLAWEARRHLRFAAHVGRGMARRAQGVITGQTVRTATPGNSRA